MLPARAPQRVQHSRASIYRPWSPASREARRARPDRSDGRTAATRLRRFGADTHASMLNERGGSCGRQGGRIAGLIVTRRDETRLIEFGRLAAIARQQRGERRPETFAFLGLAHYCGWTRDDRFIVKHLAATSDHSPLDTKSGPTRVTSGKSRGRENRLPGSVRVKPNCRASRPRPNLLPPRFSAFLRDAAICPVDDLEFLRWVLVI
jgi:hypothetical protein